MDALDKYWAEMEQKTKDEQHKKPPKKMDALDKYWAEINDNQPQIEDAGMIEAENTGPLTLKVPFTDLEYDLGQTPYIGKPLEAGATALAGILGKTTAGIEKGMTLGALDPERGTVGIPIIQNLFPQTRLQVTRPLGEYLAGQGVPEGLAQNPYVGLPGEIAGGFAPVGAISRGISAATKGALTAGSKLATAGETAATGATLGQRIGQLAGRVGHAAAVGGIVATTQDINPDETMLDNIGRGAIYGAGLQVIGEGIGAIANAVKLADKAKAYRSLRNSLAEWAYGEGRYSSLDAAKKDIGQMINKDIQQLGGLKNVTKAQAQQMQQFIKSQGSTAPINVTPETGSGVPLVKGSPGASPQGTMSPIPVVPPGKLQQVETPEYIGTDRRVDIATRQKVDNGEVTSEQLAELRRQKAFLEERKAARKMEEERLASESLLVPREEINKFIDEALTNNKGDYKTLSVKAVGTREAKDINELLGLDVSNFVHQVNSNDIRHLMDEHGDPVAEAKKKQIAVTKEDILKIPDIIDSYDSMTSKRKKNGQISLVYKKRTNGSTSFVEFVSPKKGVLMAKTMWKKPSESVGAGTEGSPSTVDAQSAPSSISSTVEISSAGSDAGVNAPPELIVQNRNGDSSTSNNIITQNQKNSKLVSSNNSQDFEIVVKEAGFKDLGDVHLAFVAKEKGFKAFAAELGGKPSKEAAMKFRDLKQKLDALPEDTQNKLKFDLQMFSDLHKRATGKNMTWNDYLNQEKIKSLKEQYRQKITELKASAKQEKKAAVNIATKREVWRRLLHEKDSKLKFQGKLAELREKAKRKEELNKKRLLWRRLLNKQDAAERHEINKLIRKLKRIDVKHLRPEYKRPVQAVLDELNLKTPTRKTVNRLTRIAQYLEANPENRIPKETVAKLKILGRKNIRDMSLEEIRTVHDAVLHYVQLNILKNKLIMKGRYQEAAEIKKDAISRIQKLKTKRTETPGFIDTSRPKTDSNPIIKLHKLQLNAEVITQILDGDKGGTFFKVFYDSADEGRDSELSVHFGAKDLIDAGLEKAGINPKDLMPWSEYFNTRKSAVEYQTIKLQSGQEFKFTRGDRIALYLHSLNDNNRASILKGGIYPEKNKTLKIRLTESDLNKILDGMTKEEKAVADIFYDLYNNFSKEKLNERSLELDGFERGTVANYYPKKTPELEKNYDPLKPRDTPYARFTTEGQGFLKERTGAHKAIILEDAFKTLYQHLEGLGAYYGRSTYLRNARMLLNDKQFRRELEAVDNGYTWKRLEKFVNDFESFGTKREDIDRVVSGWLNRIDTSILGANPKIIIKQFLSYPLMFNQINPKYLLSTMGKKVDWDTIFKYSPQLRQRREGDVSVETGELGRVGAVRRFFTGKEAIGSKLTRGIEAADGVQLGNAWHAVEIETKELHPSLTPGSEEYYKHVAKRTEEVFRRSQSVFDPKDRSELGRSQNLAWRIITRFTSQRNVIYNELIRSVLDWKQSNKTTGDFLKMAFRLFNCTVVASSLMAIIEALWGLVVKRKSWDKVLEDNAPWKLAQIFLGDFLGYSYLAGDAYDFITQIKERGAFGTELSNPLMDTFKETGIAIGEMWKAIEQLKTGEVYKSGPNKWKPKWQVSASRAADSAATAISRLLGMPYYNIKTLIKSGKSYIFRGKTSQGKKLLKF